MIPVESPAAEPVIKKVVFVTIEQPVDMPGHITEFWKEMLEQMGVEAHAFQTFEETLAAIKKPDNKCDILVVDPVSARHFFTPQHLFGMPEKTKQIAWNLLEAAKERNVTSVVMFEKHTTGREYDETRLKTLSDYMPQHGDYDATMGAVRTAIANGKGTGPAV